MRYGLKQQTEWLKQRTTAYSESNGWRADLEILKGLETLYSFILEI